MPEWFTSASDPRKRAISVRHLLALRSGFAWKEFGGASNAQMTASPHWVDHVLALPLASDPGQRYDCAPAIPSFSPPCCTKSRG